MPHARSIPPLVLVVASLALTTPALAAPKLTLPQVAFDKTVLPNGLQVILHVDKKLPIVHVNLWYHVGSKNEKPGHTGFAHLFEHMMLQGSKNAAQDFFTLMQRAGAMPGRDSNGTTQSDRTNYFSTAPAGSLEFLLWVHSDLLATLLDGMTQAKLDNQRAVVRNERRQSYDNVPYGRWYPLIAAAVFPAGHPYSWPVIGSHEDLAAASLEDVKDFFRTYYTPNNLSLVVSGDFDPAVAKRLVEKYFGSIPPGPALDRPRHWIPRLEGEKVVEVNDRVPQERVYLAWPAPEIGAPGEPELDLASDILTDGLSARLQKTLVYDKKLASAVGSSNESDEIAGLFVVNATARPGAALPEIERLIAAEIARFAKEGPSATELERARTKHLTEFTRKLENIGAFGGKADVLNYYNTYFGDPGQLAEDLRRTLRATPASVRAAAATWLATPNRVVVRFHPETSMRPQGPPLDRSKPPALGADTRFHPPAVTSERLPNGLELLVVERHELPMVVVGLAARAGSASDPPGKEGLARLATNTMARGTKQHDALAVTDALGDLGASLHTDFGFDSASLAVQVQKVNAPAAVGLLAEIVRSPTYPTGEVDRERKLQLDRIDQQEKDAREITRRLLGRFVYGAGHPYGHPGSGYRRSVTPLTAEDVRQFQAATWRPGNAMLLLVGDITPAEARALANKDFATWTGAAPTPPPPPARTPEARGKIVVVDRPNAAQTQVSQIYGAPADKGDDYYAWKLASEVLGGGTSGRLNMNLRQDKGYSYGVFAWTDAYQRALAWIGQGAVQTDKTKESVVEFVKELKGLAGARPIAAAELEDARLGLIRNYATGFATNADVASQVYDLWSRRWPIAELDREPEELGKAKLADVQAAARRYAVPTAATLLLVGDRAKIEPGLRALGVGEVIVVDVEGNPVAAR